MITLLSNNVICELEILSLVQIHHICQCVAFIVPKKITSASIGSTSSIHCCSWQTSCFRWFLLRTGNLFSAVIDFWTQGKPSNISPGRSFGQIGPHPFKLRDSFLLRWRLRGPIVEVWWDWHSLPSRFRFSIFLNWLPDRYVSHWFADGPTMNPQVRNSNFNCKHSSASCGQ